MPRHDKHLDPRVLQRVAEGARLGMKYALIAEYAGISESSLYDWKARAKAGSEEHQPFLEALESNEAAGAAALLARVQTAAKDPRYWTAAAWILERRYGYVARTEVTGKDGGPVEVGASDLTRMSPEQLRELRALAWGEDEPLTLATEPAEAK